MSGVIEISDSAVLITAGWDDVPHLDEEDKRQLLARTQPYLRDARSKGIPSLGSGAIYPLEEDRIKVPSFPIPAHWKRGKAVDVGWNWTAVVWGAEDPETSVHYIYSVYKVGQQPVPIHAAAINARGAWIPGCVDPAANGRNQKDGEQLIENYRLAGVPLVNAINAVEAGIYDTWALLEAGRLKVFAHLSEWFAEQRLYRRDEKGKIIKKNDHVMDATRYYVTMGRLIAIQKPFADDGSGRFSGSANPMGY